LVERKFATEGTTGDLKHLLARRARVWPPPGAVWMDPRLLGDAFMRLAGKG